METQSVIDEATERLEERYWLKAQGYDLEKITIRVSKLMLLDFLDITPLNINFMDESFKIN